MSSRHVKKNTHHGKKRNKAEHYHGEKHSLQGKTGKVRLHSPLAYLLSNVS